MASPFAKYAVNRTPFEVQMIDSKIKVAPGGWQGITEGELSHPDIIDALRKEWIELKDGQPKGPAKPERPKVQTINHSDSSFSGEKEPSGATVKRLGE